MKRDYGWFRLAEKLRMTLADCKERHSERVMQLWMTYDAEEMNAPDKTSAYFMRLTMEVRLLNERIRTLFGGKMVEPKLEEFKLAFGESERQPLSRDKAAEISKQVWLGAVGLGVVHKTRTRTEARALGLID